MRALQNVDQKNGNLCTFMLSLMKKWIVVQKYGWTKYIM